MAGGVVDAFKPRAVENQTRKNFMSSDGTLDLEAHRSKQRSLRSSTLTSSQEDRLKTMLHNSRTRLEMLTCSIKSSTDSSLLPPASGSLVGRLNRIIRDCEKSLQALKAAEAQEQQKA